jgi:hypothetical protein
MNHNGLLGDVVLIKNEKNEGKNPPSPPQQWYHVEIPLSPIGANTYTRKPFSCEFGLLRL